MSADMRQFVYLDSQAVNSLLASRFMAVPEKVRQVTEETDEEGDEKEGEAKLNLGNLLNLGGGLRKTTTETNRDLSEVDKQINDQYRFSILIRALQEDDSFEIHDISGSDTVGDVGSGELVRLEGTCSPDPLYPLLGALEYVTKATSEAPDGDGFWAQMIQNQSDLGQVQQFYQLLYGGWVGLEISPDESEYNFGTVINENQMWTNSYREFRGTNKYTILGRVQNQIPDGEIWDLIEALRVINSAVSDDESESNRAKIIAKVLDSMEEQEGSEDYDLPDLKPDDFIVQGPAMIINPIAIYW